MQQLLSAEDELDREVRKLREKRDVLVSIGTFHTAAVRIFPDFIRKFMEKDPAAEFRVKERGQYQYIRDDLLEHGLYTTGHKNTFKIAPALIITEDQMNAIMDQVDAVMYDFDSLCS